MPTVTTPPPRPGQDRPSNREVENENQRPDGGGKSPRPATEPRGAETSSDSPKTRTDPGSGEA
ncbi:hypothetical protein EV278_11930 [Caulobacter sp. BK020]|nr:hypothetical protein [Caulobacter sp. BK020]TCS10174.1 hypothetical protein EV278_11930 [Caulobacter sp. BK020]